MGRGEKERLEREEGNKTKVGMQNTYIKIYK